MYWQRGCHDPPAGRPNCCPSTSTQQAIHQQVQVLGEHRTLADGSPARRYKTSPTRGSQNTSWSIIISSSPSFRHQQRGRRGPFTAKRLSTSLKATRVKGVTAPLPSLSGKCPCNAAAGRPMLLYGVMIVFVPLLGGRTFLMSTLVASPFSCRSGEEEDQLSL